MGERRGVDPKCFELADHFLHGIGVVVTAIQRIEFAEAIQAVCEDHCQDIEEHANG